MLNALHNAFCLLGCWAHCCSHWTAGTSSPRSRPAELLPSLYPVQHCSIPGSAHDIFLCWTVRCWLWSNASMYFNPSVRLFSPQGVSSTPQLYASPNLLRIHSTPAYRSPTIPLNRINPRNEPWRMLLVIVHQSDVAPFTRTFWTLLSRHFITQHQVNLFISQLNNLSRRIPWGMVSKVLLKYRMITFAVFPTLLLFPRLFPFLLCSSCKEEHTTGATSELWIYTESQ